MSSCCRVALLGFGTVGSAVARRLASGRRDFQFTHILDRGAAIKRGGPTTAGAAWTSGIDEVLESLSNQAVSAFDRRPQAEVM